MSSFQAQTRYDRWRSRRSDPGVPLRSFPEGVNLTNPVSDKAYAEGA